MFGHKWLLKSSSLLRPLSSSSSSMLYGVHPIQLALESGKRDIHRIYYNAKQLKDSKRIALIVNNALKKGIQVVPMSVNVLDNLARSSAGRERVAHQGVLADVEPMRMDVIHQETEAEARDALWLLSVGARDPNNLGNMIRTAYFMGVERFVLAANNDSELYNDKVRCKDARNHGLPSLSAVVSKTSGGVLEIFPPSLLIEDISTFLAKKKRSGWNTIASAVEEDSDKSASNIKSDVPTILVVGGEGSGLSSKVVDCCDYRLHIRPGRRLHELVDSLNVTVATGLLIDKVRMMQKELRPN